MKNKISIIIGLIIMLVVVGFISVLSVRSAKRDESKLVLSVGGEAKLRNTIELPVSQVAELEISYTSNNLKVYPTEGDAIIIKEYLISDKEESKARVLKEQIESDAKGRHKVTVNGSQNQVFTIFGFNAGQERIEIYLPTKGLEVLTMEVGSGNIKVMDEFTLETKQLQVTAKSGNINWQDTKAEHITFKANSGNIAGKDLKADLEVETGSGTVKLETVEGNVALAAGSGTIRVMEAVGKLAVANGSGTVNVEHFKGNGSFAAGSGTIRLDMEEVTGDIAVSTGSGNIHLTVPENLSFELEVKTGSGNIRTGFDEALSYNKKGNQASGTIGAAPVCKIEVEANSGNVDIAAE